MSVQKPREIAAQVLERAMAKSPREGSSGTVSVEAVASTSRYTEELLASALHSAHLTPEDRRLCQELVYGVVRWKLTLSWLIEQKARQKPAPGLQNLLSLGLYQIFWLDRIPEHAAVNETVELAKRLGFGAQAGFVNALLRGYLREYESTKDRLIQLKAAQPAVGFSHPEWLIERWRTQWDRQSVEQLLQWNNTPPATFARVNLLKVAPGDLLAQWRNERVEYEFVRKDWFDEGSIFELKSHPPIETLKSFQQGYFYVQDPSTLLAGRCMAARPEEEFLDLCAAPGGKLTFIAQLMNNKGRIVAYDISSERRKLVQENCARLGVTSVQIVSEFPSSRADRFDHILIDAPCSNTGVMRRRVDLRWRIRVEEIQRLRGVQLDLLRQAAPLLKTHGTLVYSTCSLEREENEEVVGQFCRERNEFRVEQERRLLPFRERVDGAYVAVLKR